MTIQAGETYLGRRIRRPAIARSRPAFRIGDWVEVRSLAEVLATLDSQGSLEGLPFMPEMAKHCGRRFQIVKSAHKTCDPTGLSDMRKMPDAVHLNIRCDGAAHGGCEARCQFFWKTAWLKEADGPFSKDRPPEIVEPEAMAGLHAATRYMTDQGLRYRCQATEIVRATERLSPKNLRQYVEDISSGNVRPAYFVRHVCEAVGKAILGRLRKLLTRHPLPAPASCPSAAASPAKAGSSLGLSPGEFVTVKSAKDIMSTLDAQRGPTFEPEMFRHCGRTHRILYRVSRIIDERSGKMVKLANDCVVLDGITCAGLDNKARLFCPRSCYYFWREAWLTRTAATAGTPAQSAAE